jgi:hypothetical protein
MLEEEDEYNLQDQQRAHFSLSDAFQILVDEHQEQAEEETSHRGYFALNLHEVDIADAATEGNRNRELEVQGEAL